MTTDQLRLFLVIARHRSLSRAAAELNLGPSTVSERLQALEAEVGAPLFERQGRGVTLSAAGQAFKPYAERALEVLQQAQESVRAASHGQRGQVTIAATVTAGAHLLAPALVAFRQAHPQVEVRVRSAHSWDAPGLLLDGLVELALISGPSLNPNIETVAAFTGRLVIVAGRAHVRDRLAHHVSLDELAREAWVVSFWGPASQRFLEQIQAARSDQDGGWTELSPVELVKGMLIAGAGLSLLPEVAVRRELESGELVKLALDKSVPRLPPWEISLIRRRQPRPHPAAEALADTLRLYLPKLTR
jgi:DNA-binding transcriptional LysR family regulator